MVRGLFEGNLRVHKEFFAKISRTRIFHVLQYQVAFSLLLGADPNATDSLDRSALVIAFIILELDNIHSMTQTKASTSDVQKQSLLGTDGQVCSDIHVIDRIK